MELNLNRLSYLDYCELEKKIRRQGGEAVYPADIAMYVAKALGLPWEGEAYHDSLSVLSMPEYLAYVSEFWKKFNESIAAKN